MESIRYESISDLHDEQDEEVEVCDSAELLEEVAGQEGDHGVLGRHNKVVLAQKIRCQADAQKNINSNKIQSFKPNE